MAEYSIGSIEGSAGAPCADSGRATAWLMSSRIRSPSKPTGSAPGPPATPSGPTGVAPGPITAPAGPTAPSAGPTSVTCEPTAVSARLTGGAFPAPADATARSSRAPSDPAGARIGFIGAAAGSAEVAARPVEASSGSAGAAGRGRLATPAGAGSFASDGLDVAGGSSPEGRTTAVTVPVVAGSSTGGGLPPTPSEIGPRANAVEASNSEAGGLSTGVAIVAVGELPCRRSPSTGTPPAGGVPVRWSTYRSGLPCSARFPMPKIRSSRVTNPGFDSDGAGAPSWLCRAMRLASLQPLLGPPHRGIVRAAAVGVTSRTDCPSRPADSISDALHHPSGSRLPTLHRTRRPAMEPNEGLAHPPPRGLRAGTPDRRGKRGEVEAIFAMITTEPTWSIGELGLGITSRSSPPKISHARASCSNSSSLG